MTNMTSAKYSILDESNVEDASVSSNKSVGDTPDGGAVAWLHVVAAFCINLSTWGVINMYGVFQTYYTKHLLQHESELKIAWIGSVQGALLLFVCFFMGPVYDAGYSTALIYLGAPCTVLGMMMTSFCTEYWQLLLAQGFVVGVGTGLIYLPGVSIISQYFKRRRALAFGIASLGSSTGGILFPIVFRQLQPRIGFGWATRAIASIQFATLIVPMIWMKPRTRSATTKKLLDKELLTDWPFFLMMIGMFFGYMGVYVTYCYIQLYALAKCNTSVDLASYMLAITNAGSLIGRVIPNYIADEYLGPMNTHILFTAISIVLAFGWIAVRNTPALIVFSLMDGFFSGTFVSLAGPIIFSLTPDPNTMGTRIGMTTAICGMGLLIGSPAAGAILDRGSWVPLQIWAASLVLVAGLFILWARIVKFGANIRNKV